MSISGLSFRHVTSCLAAVLLLFAACGGGGGNKRAQTIATLPPDMPSVAATVNTGASTATATATAQIHTPDLDAALLTLADMPTGWTVLPPSESSAVSTEYCGDDPWTIAPVARAARDFQKNDFERASQGVRAYRHGDAAKAMQSALIVFNSCITWTATTKDGTTETYHLAPLSFPRLGDDTIAVRLTYTGQGAAEADAVYIRRGDLIAVIANFAVGLGIAKVDSALTEQLARKADAKLAVIAH